MAAARRTDKPLEERHREQPRDVEDAAGAADALGEYRAMRRFERTPEPAGRAGKPHHKPIFVVQEHHATHLHYDFRLEADGVLKSWAVPKGPSTSPAEKRLAVRVEDHPLGYADFAGTIPEGQYGAGTVEIWDRGTWEHLGPGTVAEGLEAGRLDFTLAGEKLVGRFALVRMGGKRRGKENWLLIKARDEHARPGGNGKAPPAPARRAKAAPAPPPRPAAPPADVEVTNADKVFFPEAGYTKGDVFDYYRRVARWLLPHLKDRPVTLERLPEGVREGAAHFWQKNTPAHYPDWVPRVEMPDADGRPVRYVLVNDLQTLLYLVNQGALTFHTWPSRVSSPDRPDFVLFDLDPGEAGLAAAAEVARRLHAELKAEGHEALVKTSGRSGLHVLAPWRESGGYEEAREWARSVAARVAEALPERATVEVRKAKRAGRVYVDVLQNARGHHAVPPYVLRAVPGATVSMPLAWSEVTARLSPGRFEPRAALRRLARQKRDPLAALLPKP